MTKNEINIKKNTIIIAVIVLVVFLIIFSNGGIQVEGNNDNYGSSETIVINGINQKRTLNHPSETIDLILNGQYNVVTITKETIISRIDLNGVGNIINLCSTHSPQINENGIDNNIKYLSC